VKLFSLNKHNDTTGRITKLYTETDNVRTIHG